MMPDLGRYWLEVTASYAVGLALLGLIVLLVWRRSRAVRVRLAEIEGRRAAEATGTAERTAADA